MFLYFISPFNVLLSGTLTCRCELISRAIRENHQAKRFLIHISGDRFQVLHSKNDAKLTIFSCGDRDIIVEAPNAKIDGAKGAGKLVQGWLTESFILQIYCVSQACFE